MIDHDLYEIMWYHNINAFQCISHHDSDLPHQLEWKQLVLRGKVRLSNHIVDSPIGPQATKHGRMTNDLHTSPTWKPIQLSKKQVSGVFFVAPENLMNKKSAGFSGDLAFRTLQVCPRNYLSRVRTASIWLLAPTLCISWTKNTNLRLDRLDILGSHCYHCWLVGHVGWSKLAEMI